MKKTIASVIMWFTGWKLAVDPKDERVRHCVLVAAPHTSNWDLLHAIAALWKLGIPVRFLIKDSYLKNPFTRPVIKWLGGIGVSRTQKNNLVDYTACLLEKDPELVIMLAPEGTRSRVEQWKTGFYKIAMKARVPIGIAFLDYREKKAGLLGFINPGGNYAQDLAIIEEFYKGVTAKKPEKWNPHFSEPAK